MLTQLTCLSIEADGRYATAEELQFIKGYFESLDQRVSAYEKIRTAAEEIISQVEAKMRNLDSKIFIGASGDFSERWKRDISQQLRYIAASLLLNEHEYLREGFLVWFKTIVSSYKFDRTCQTTFKVMPEVVKQYLTSEEAALFCQILAIHQIILS